MEKKQRELPNVTPLPEDEAVVEEIRQKLRETRSEADAAIAEAEQVLEQMDSSHTEELGQEAQPESPLPKQPIAIEPVKYGTTELPPLPKEEVSSFVAEPPAAALSRREQKRQEKLERKLQKQQAKAEKKALKQAKKQGTPPPAAEEQEAQPAEELYEGIRIRSFEEIQKEMAEQNPEVSEPTSSFAYLYDDTAEVPLAEIDEEALRKRRAERAQKAVADALAATGEIPPPVKEEPEETPSIIIQGFDFQEWKRNTNAIPKVTEEMQQGDTQPTEDESHEDMAHLQQHIDTTVAEIAAIMEEALSAEETAVEELAKATKGESKPQEKPAPKAEEKPAVKAKAAVKPKAQEPAKTEVQLEAEAEQAAEELLKEATKEIALEKETTPQEQAVEEEKPEPEKKVELSSEGIPKETVITPKTKQETPAPQKEAPKEKTAPKEDSRDIFSDDGKPAQAVKIEGDSRNVAESIEQSAKKVAAKRATATIKLPAVESVEEPAVEVTPKKEESSVKIVPPFVPALDPERYRLSSLPLRTYRLAESTALFAEEILQYATPKSEKGTEKKQAEPSKKQEEPKKPTPPAPPAPKAEAPKEQPEQATTPKETAPPAVEATVEEKIEEKTEEKAEPSAAQESKPEEPVSHGKKLNLSRETSSLKEAVAAALQLDEAEEKAKAAKEVSQEMPTETVVAPEGEQVAEAAEAAPAVEETATTEAAEADGEDKGFHPSALLSKLPFFHSEGEGEEADQEETESTEEYHMDTDPKAIVKELRTATREMHLRIAATGVFTAALLILQLICGWILPDTINPYPYLVMNLVFLLIPSAICSKTIFNGIRALFTLQGNTDSGISVAALASIVQGIAVFFSPALILQGQIYFYSAIAVGMLLVNSIGKLSMLSRIARNFHYVSSKEDKYAVEIYEDMSLAIQLAKGVVTDTPQIAYRHKAKFLTHFLRNSYDTDPSIRTSQLVTPIAFIASAALFIVVLIITHNVIFGLTAFSLATCISAPIASLLCVNLPVANLCRLARRHGAMLTGYSALEELSKANAVMLSSTDLFPSDSVTLADVKVYEKHRSEEAILSAASMVQQLGGTLKDLFRNVIATQEEMLPLASNVQYREHKGISGTVKGKAILLGNLAMLEEQQIPVPKEDRDPYLQKNEGALYLAEDGKLVALLKVSYHADVTMIHELQRLERCSVATIVRTLDPILTESFLASQFMVHDQLIKVLPLDLGQLCDDVLEGEKEEAEALLATRGKPFAMLRVLSACNRQKHNITVAVTLQIVSVIIGFLLVAFLSCYAGLQQLTTLSILIYELFWLVAIVVIPKLRKP